MRHFWKIFSKNFLEIIFQKYCVAWTVSAECIQRWTDLKAVWKSLSLSEIQYPKLIISSSKIINRDLDFQKNRACGAAYNVFWPWKLGFRKFWDFWKIYIFLENLKITFGKSEFENKRYAPPSAPGRGAAPASARSGPRWPRWVQLTEITHVLPSFPGARQPGMEKTLIQNETPNFRGR